MRGGWSTCDIRVQARNLFGINLELINQKPNNENKSVYNSGMKRARKLLRKHSEAFVEPALAVVSPSSHNKHCVAPCSDW